MGLHLDQIAEVQCLIPKVVGDGIPNNVAGDVKSYWSIGFKIPHGGI